MQKDQNTAQSRRNFIKQGAALAGGLMIVPSHVISGLGHTPPSDMLNIAAVGVGGMGRSNLDKLKTQHIVALCDIDWAYAQQTFDLYPNAKRYKDYRRMLEEMDKDIDAVVVATPDHTHYVITADAMRAGKHVYVQKPLTHSVYESRMLTQLARETGVATQMGNQGNSGDGTKLICEMIWNGEIGEVREVHTWTNRPIWPQGIEKPTDTPPVPDTLDWDLFLGPAPWRDYNPAYTPWNWRAWWDFGTGALGDMGCHIIDSAFKALDLGYPSAFEASSSMFNIDCAPVAEKVTYYFPARPKKYKVNMPPVKMIWYDGGLMPERPEGLTDGKMLGAGGGGTMFIGSKGIAVCNVYGNDPYIVSKEQNPVVPERLRKIEGGSNGHEMDWVRACKENKESRVEASSHFGYSGPLNEVVVMGNLAVRLQQLNRKFDWDAANMQIANISDNEELTVRVKGRETVKVNAKAAAQEYIKHNYREGWSY
ncbi:MAG: Gfo/Idh/MocA family oxidoreductase [Microscillaceae bacterium]|nr:Gfo/Idh/MocA family oxidoreductase [Microscillaceae bacterium]